MKTTWRRCWRHWAGHRGPLTDSSTTAKGGLSCSEALPFFCRHVSTSGKYARDFFDSKVLPHKHEISWPPLFETNWAPALRDKLGVPAHALAAMHLTCCGCFVGCCGV